MAIDTLNLVAHGLNNKETSFLRLDLVCNSFKSSCTQDLTLKNYGNLHRQGKLVHVHSFWFCVVMRCSCIIIHLFQMSCPVY